VAYSVPAETNVLPVPGAQNFRYHRPFRLGGDKPKVATKKTPASAGAKAKDPATTGTVASAARPAGQPRFGHQLTVVRPPINLTSQPATVSR
jgi:hypothetical protein